MGEDDVGQDEEIVLSQSVCKEKLMEIRGIAL